MFDELQHSHHYRKIHKPKHMPHNPVSKTSRITHSNSPLNVNSKTEKLKIKTSVVWKHITRVCVTTCEKSISTAVTPDTRHRSKIPSFLSISMAPDVSATDKKKIILKGKQSEMLFRSKGVAWKISMTEIDESLLSAPTASVLSRWLIRK